MTEDRHLDVLEMSRDPEVSRLTNGWLARAAGYKCPYNFSRLDAQSSNYLKISSPCRKSSGGSDLT